MAKRTTREQEPKKRGRGRAITLRRSSAAELKIDLARASREQAESTAREVRAQFGVSDRGHGPDF